MGGIACLHGLRCAVSSVAAAAAGAAGKHGEAPTLFRVLLQGDPGSTMPIDARTAFTSANHSSFARLGSLRVRLGPREGRAELANNENVLVMLA